MTIGLQHEPRGQGPRKVSGFRLRFWAVASETQPVTELGQPPLHRLKSCPTLGHGLDSLARNALHGLGEGESTRSKAEMAAPSRLERVRPSRGHSPRDQPLGHLDQDPSSTSWYWTPGPCVDPCWDDCRVGLISESMKRCVLSGLHFGKHNEGEIQRRMGCAFYDRRHHHY